MQEDDWIPSVAMILRVYWDLVSRSSKFVVMIDPVK